MPIINIVSAVQVSEALKLLTGRIEDLHESLMQFDVWRNEWRRIGTGAPRADCQTCGLAVYETLSRSAEAAAVLCGRDAIQISPAQPTRVNFSSLAERLRRAGEVKFNEYLLRFKTGEFELTVGNRQLLSGFFIVVLLFAVAFAMGYVVGQYSPRSSKLSA